MIELTGKRVYLACGKTDMRKSINGLSAIVQASFKLDPMSALGAAIHYAFSQRQYLERYLLDGRLEISNNRAERSIKPFVIGRKNFLFANTPRGANASAVMYSLIETAKENRLNPFDFLVRVFQNAPNWDIRNNFDALQWLLPFKQGMMSADG